MAALCEGNYPADASEESRAPGTADAGGRVFEVMAAAFETKTPMFRYFSEWSTAGTTGIITCGKKFAAKCASKCFDAGTCNIAAAGLDAFGDNRLFSAGIPGVHNWTTASFSDSDTSDLGIH